MIAAEIYSGLTVPYKNQFIRSLGSTQQTKAHEIIDLVCSHFKVDKSSALGQCRKREFTLARQISCYFIKQKTTLSLKAIGALFDGRDHSTVIYAIQTINDLIDTDRKFAKTMVVLEDMLSGVHKEDSTLTEIPTVA